MTRRTLRPSLERTDPQKREMHRNNRKIIIGYEPTSEGLDALELGELLAGTLAARPVIATVVPWPDHLMSDGDREQALAASTTELFAVARDRLDALEPLTRGIANPSPAEALYELAGREKAMLIVVGSTHRGTLGRVILGSVGVSLLQGAPCAVAVAPRDYAADRKHRLLRVGVAFDGSAEGWAALETGIGLAESLHAAFAVLTVAEAPRYGYGGSFSMLTAGEGQTYGQEEKRRILDSAMGRIPRDLAVEGRLLNGDPGASLAEASEDFDLLVMGSRGYGPLGRTLLGSVASRVMHSAGCPVLVLPRGAGMDPLRVREANTTASKPDWPAPPNAVDERP